MKRLKHLSEYVFFRILLVLLSLLGLEGARWLGPRLGWIAFNVFRIRREVTLSNLERAFPEWDEHRRVEVAKLCYAHFGVVFLELVHLPRLSREQIFEQVDLENAGHYEHALEAGRGAVLTTGHFGNWELYGAAVAAFDFPIWVTVRTQRNRAVDSYVTRARESTGMKVIKVEDGVRSMLRVLRNNEFLSILFDQDAGRRGVFVPFLGRPASTPLGVVRFARLGRCPIIPGYSVRQPNGKYRIEMQTPIHVSEDLPSEEAESAALAEVVCQLESMIRRHPEQWFWMHRRWKTQPEMLEDQPTGIASAEMEVTKGTQ